MADTAELPRESWRAIHEYFLEVGASRTRDDLLKSAITALPRLIPFDREGGIFVARGRYLATLGACPDRVRSYNEYFQYRFPLYTGLDGTVAVDYPDSIVDWRGAMGSTEFGTDFVRPEGIARTLTAPCLWLPLTFAVHRSAFTPDFTRVEHEILQLITPHVNNLFECLPTRGPAACLLDPAAIREVFPFLSARESDIAALLCEHCTAQEMGDRLFLSVRTVETHVARIYQKLGVHSRGEAVRRLLAARVTGENER